MSQISRYFAMFFVSVGAAASIAVAPLAAADPAMPTPGSENARDTLTDLRSLGYTTQINWDNGVPDVGLSQCWVNNISTSGGGAGIKTAIVDIECPK